MTTICLVRHGETDWNREGRIQGHEDIELNAVGEEQALRCGEHLARKPWDVIITSPMKRARKTADIIRQHVPTSIFYEIDDLHERNYGLGSGLSIEEIGRLYPDGNVPGREEATDLSIRLMRALNRIVQDQRNQRIIIVSHGAVINSILTSVSEGVIGSSKTVLKNAHM